MMARIPSAESQHCSSTESGWDWRSFPVFFLYSFKAVARIDSGGSGRIGTWERKEVARDMVQLTASWIIEWSECLWAKAVKGGRLVPSG